jgi:3-methyladenine DNA glycosylase AlkD
VKKAVSWALRSIGRRNAVLHAAALAVATRLAGSKVPAARWVGKDAERELSSAAVKRRLATRRRAAK